MKQINDKLTGRRKHFFLLILGLFLLLSSVFDSLAFALPNTPPYPELDNFDRPRSASPWAWYMSALSWTEGDNTFNYFDINEYYAGEHVHGGEKAMEVIYNTHNQGWAWFPAWCYVNLEHYSHLSFWIKCTESSTGNLRLKIEFQSPNTPSLNKAIVTIPCDGQWHRIDSKLAIEAGDGSSGSFDFSYLSGIIFVVEAGQTGSTGTFYLDDIQVYDASLSAPTINAISDPEGDRRYTVDWSSVGGAGVYEIWEDNESIFVVNDGSAPGTYEAGWNSGWPSRNNEFFDHTGYTSDVNVALSSEGAVISDAGGNAGANLLINGNIDLAEYTAINVGSSVVIDLQEEYLLKELKFYSVAGNLNCKYKIYLAGTNGVYGSAVVDTADYVNGEQVHTITPQSARYVKFEAVAARYMTYPIGAISAVEIAAIAEVSVVDDASMYHYKVRAWNKPPMQDGVENPDAVCSLWSDIEAVTLTDPRLILDDPGVADFDGNYTLEWTLITDAVKYTLEEAINEDFTEGYQAYPDLTDKTKVFTKTASGVYYYRVIAYDAYDNQMDVSNVRMLRVVVPLDQTAGHLLSNADAVPTIWDIVNNTLTYPAELSGNADLYDFYYYGDGPFLNSYKTLGIRIKTDATAIGPEKIVIDFQNSNAEIFNKIVVVDPITDRCLNKDNYIDILYPLTAAVSINDQVTKIRVKIQNDGDNEGDVDSEGNDGGVVYIEKMFLSSVDYIANPLPAVENTQGTITNPDEFLDKLEADMAFYFYNTVTDEPYYFPLDVSNIANRASTGAIGFGLSALAVLYERIDTSDAWTRGVNKLDILNRVNMILDGLLKIQKNQATDELNYGKYGFSYHFLNHEGKRDGNSEISLADSAILMAGVIQVGEYFKSLDDDSSGDDDAIFTKAEIIFKGGVYDDGEGAYSYTGTNWSAFLSVEPSQADRFYLSWMPVDGEDGDFVGAWDYYTDEILLISFLAAARHPENMSIKRSFFSFARDLGSYTAQTGVDAGTNYSHIQSFFGSAFTYIYAHCFIDFQGLAVEDDPGLVGISGVPGVNWWNNSVDAFKVQKQFCQDRAEYYPFSFGKKGDDLAGDEAYSFGLTACQRYSGRYEDLYGAVPMKNGPLNDGTVAPWVMVSALPFFKDPFNDVDALEENPAFASIWYLYQNYHNLAFGAYGMVDSFDDSAKSAGSSLGINVGASLMMLENYRTAQIWRSFSNNTDVQAVFTAFFDKQPDQRQQNSMNVKSSSPFYDTTIEFGTIDYQNLPVNYPAVSCGDYLIVNYQFDNDVSGGVQIYTDNSHADADPKFAPSWYYDEEETIPADGVGLIGADILSGGNAYNVPLFWAVFPTKQLNGYLFSEEVGNGPDDFSFANAAWVQDKKSISFYGALNVDDIAELTAIMTGVSGYTIANLLADLSANGYVKQIEGRYCLREKFYTDVFVLPSAYDAVSGNINEVLLNSYSRERSYRTLVKSNNDLANFPFSGRKAYGTAYLYAGANFKQAMNQTYRTSTLTLELYVDN